MSKNEDAKRILAERLATDPEALEADAAFHGMSAAEMEFGSFDVDPVMVEEARSKRLRQITIRIGEEQLAEAQRVADETGEKYQRVIRRWLAREASLSRQQRSLMQRKLEREGD